MKSFNKSLYFLFGGIFLFSSCEDFLNKEPIDAVTPETYLMTDADLTAYAVKQYSFTTHQGAGIGIWANDNHTDNQTTSSYSTQWIPGEWRVEDNPDDNSEPYSWGNIYNCNYFLETVVPRYEEGVLTGSEEMIRHNIGEMYFLRAWNYFSKLKTFGDYPIVTETLPDDKQALIEASRRQPRHKVARFILEDLDRAIGFLSENPEGGTNRISRYVANLVKSRVALYEARWETYHAGTALVPNGPGWPGEPCDYDAQSEISFFLSECKKSAQEVADVVPLAENTHVGTDGAEKMNNPYFAQFGADNMSSYPEILMWRDYNIDMGLMHSTTFYLRVGGNSGYTRQFMETFLMNNGLPVYAAGSNYRGDATIEDVRTDRDERWLLFTMTPGETLTEGETDFRDTLSYLPNIVDIGERRNVTGYQLRKGYSNHWCRDWNQSSEGCPIFRAAEAYLNYIEASCMENGGASVDGKAQGYWRQLRERAGLPGDYMITVNATDLSREGDWAVYSAGQQVSPLLYNIRRERRCELMQEGMRMDDLKSWRALDQLDGTWQPEGFNLWGPNDWEAKYATAAENGNSEKLVYDGSDKSNVSSPQLSTYLRPHEILNVPTNLMYGKGYDWCQAHYLNPIAIKHFRDTATDPGDLSTSVIYQNPGWPLIAQQGAEKD